MGDVAKAEYECWATYVQIWDHLLKYNDKERSPKLPKENNLNNTSS
jgi:hypothetical protein